LEVSTNSSGDNSVGSGLKLESLLVLSDLFGLRVSGELELFGVFVLFENSESNIEIRSSFSSSVVSFIFLMNTNGNLIILSNSEGVGVLRDNPLFVRCLFLDINEFTGKSDFVPFTNIAETNFVELLNEVFNGDPESTVVSIEGGVEEVLGTFNFVPKLRGIAPVSLPYARGLTFTRSSPRISNLEKSHGLIGIFELLNLNDSISVSSGKSIEILSLDLLRRAVESRGSSNDEASFSVDLLKIVEHSISIRHIISSNNLSRASSEISESFSGRSSREGQVVTVNLGVGLLEKDHPQFRSITLGEDGSTSGKTRDVVIDGNNLPLSALADSNLVDTFVVYFLSNEKSLDKLGVLSNRSNGGKEPTVTEHTLLDIVGVDTILEHRDGT